MSQKIPQFELPGSFNPFQIEKVRKNLEAQGCWPISTANLVITASFHDGFGDKMIQIKNSANDHVSCIPVSIAYYLYDMPTVWTLVHGNTLLDTPQHDSPPVDDAAANILANMISSHESSDEEPKEPNEEYEQDEQDEQDEPVYEADQAKCDKCDRVFNTKRGLGIHMAYIHKKAGPKSMKRTLENEVPKTKKRLRRHTGYTEFMKSKDTDKKWSELSLEEQKPYILNAERLNRQEGFVRN